MEGKPFAIIETDGHSGDAGTKTRVEAFLHCVREDLAAERVTVARELDRVTDDRTDLAGLMATKRRVLIPRMGPGAEALAACLRGLEVPAEALPLPDRETLRIGRRYTSGKECVPMCITLGSLLQRVQAEPDGEFAFFMPTGCGPCRFGAYNVLHRIVLDRVGLGDRVTMWSPVDADYFGAVPPGFAAIAMAGFVATDLLLEGLYDARPVERERGAAQAVYDRFTTELLESLETATRGDLSAMQAVTQVVGRQLYGIRDLLERAAGDFAAARSDAKPPSVLVVGETYVRCDPFANDFVIDKLESRGIRARFVPFNEWLEYTDWAAWQKGQKRGLKMRLKSWMQRRIQEIGHEAMASVLGWPDRMSVAEVIDAGAEYLRPELFGDAILGIGGPIHAWRAGLVDGAVNVGPLECMPTKLAETQLFHAGEREELPSLTLPMNGDPLDPAVLDRFVYEVKQRYGRRTRSSTTPKSAETTIDMRS
jgi:predicted nucleotide-binding protein (sugar kinase/HSP70/actin superfamily)